MKKLLLFLFCFISYLFSTAQIPVFDWAKSLGGDSDQDPRSIAVDDSGNVYTTGVFEGFAVDFDPGPGVLYLPTAGAFISKLDATGNFVWAKEVCSSFNEYGNSIYLDPFGGVYITGTYSDTSDFDSGPGVFNLNGYGSFVLKLDINGNFVWAKNFGGQGFSVTTDYSGNVFVTGDFSGTADFDPGTGVFNLTAVAGTGRFIVKLDSTGNFVWAKNMGGQCELGGNEIVTDTVGNVYGAGGFFGTVDFNPGSGVFNLSGAPSFSNIFISKLAPDGNFLWAKSVSGTAGAGAFSITLDPIGNIITTGFFSGTADFDPNSGVVNLTSVGSGNAFISKLDSDGNYIWAKNFVCDSSVYSSFGYSLMSGPSGSIYSAGSFIGTVDFDPGIGQMNLTSVDGYNSFISKLDASGNFVWARNISSTLDQQAYTITVDATENVYTSGWFNGVGDFNTESGVCNLTSAGGHDIYVHKMSQTPAGINETSIENNIFIYPNPTNSLLNILLSFQTKSSTIEIFNCIGQLIYNQKISTQQTTVDLSNQPNGLYFLKVICENKIIASQKIIKQ